MLIGCIEYITVKQENRGITITRIFMLYEEENMKKKNGFFFLNYKTYFQNRYKRSPVAIRISTYIVIKQTDLNLYLIIYIHYYIIPNKLLYTRADDSYNRKSVQTE